MPIEKFPYLYEKFGRNPKGLAAIELKKKMKTIFIGICVKVKFQIKVKREIKVKKEKGDKEAK